ncbi:PaaI family thioesterase [Bradyrhizobium sp. SYSU BS000235]|uniref:PaaI family thioesterase n=1 Tax=Bradyrhizobium sp. SYSU BS000235 TaxID=3411332 RepID=UPI003C78F776
MTASTQSPVAMSLELASRMPGLDIIQGLLDGKVPPPPFAEITNVNPVLVERGRVTFEGTPSSQFNNHIGIVHGGWASLLLDTTMGCAVHTMLDAGYAYSTIALNVAFIKPVRALGTIRCEATVLHSGKSTASAEGRVFDSKGALLAHGSATFFVFKTGAA